MAERTPQQTVPTEGVDTLQKRGRRRLVGAIALVLLAVIVLPMVFDPEPRPNAPLVSVRIPSEDDTKFTPKAGPKPPASQGEAMQGGPETKTPEPRAVPAPATKAQTPPALAKTPSPKSASEAPKAAEKPVAKGPEKPAAPAQPLPTAGEQFMVQIGAFASADKVKEVTAKLKDGGLAHYTEPVATASGQVVRVRLGPFASRDAAENARERARALGLSPSNVAAK